MIGNVAILVELTVFHADFLPAVALEIVEIFQIWIVLKSSRLLNHVLSVFFRRFHIGDKLELLQIFGELADFAGVARSRH